MVIRFILSGYVEQAMAHAVYDKLEDGTYAGHIPPCKGVVAFGSTLRECNVVNTPLYAIGREEECHDDSSNEYDTL